MYRQFLFKYLQNLNLSVLFSKKINSIELVPDMYKIINLRLVFRLEKVSLKILEKFLSRFIWSPFMTDICELWQARTKPDMNQAKENSTIFDMLLIL